MNDPDDAGAQPSAPDNDQRRITRDDGWPGALSQKLTSALSEASDAMSRAQEALRTVHSVEQRLRVMEDRTQAMVAASSSIYWLATGAGLIEDAPHWRAFTGQSVEQVQGWGWFDAIHPDDRERAKARWRESLRQRLPYTDEYRLRRDDGAYLDFLTQAAPIYEDDGAVREWVGMCVDITTRKQLERDLRASEQIYRATFEQAATGITHVTPDGRMVLVNDQLCRLLGYSREELLALRVTDILHPDDIALDTLHARELLEGTRDRYTLERRYVRRDASLVWANMTCSLVRDGDGQPLYFIGVIEDISERKRLERGLADNVAQLEAIFEAIGDAVFVYDQYGQPVRTNSASRQIYGASPSRSYLGLPREERRRRHPAFDKDGLPLRMERRPATRALRGETFGGDDAQDVRVRTADGRMRDFNFTGAPIRHGDRIVGAVVVARDVTERRRLDRVAREAERRAAEQTRELEAALEAMIDGVAIYDTAGRLLRMNRSAAVYLALSETGGASRLAPAGRSVTGERAEESAEERLEEPAEERADVALIRQLLNGCDQDAELCVRQEEMRFLGLDGRERDLSLTGATIRDDDGRISGAVMVARDVSLRNRLERQRTDMLQMVGHDLASPLQAAQVYVQRQRRALSQAIDATRETQALSALEHSLGRIERLVGDLQLAARIELGTLRLARAPTDLVALARAEADLTATASGREVRLDAPEIPVLAHVDASRIGQSLANLLGNAHKYSEPGRPIWLTMTVEQGQACLAVEDVGPGIPATELGSIWEQFYQIKGVTAMAGSGGGLGLGLYITRNVVEAHGGAVGVKSTEGCGSTFWITLPLLTDAN